MSTKRARGHDGTVPKLTRRRLDEWDNSRKELQFRRMRIQNTLSGDFYCWPVYCTADNGWTVPAKFEVKQILGKLVFKVLDVEAKAMPVAEMTQYRISGVVGNAEGGVAPPWQYLAECDPEGKDVIKVFFGNAVIAPTIDMVHCGA
jgi:hypothetical protein